MNKGFVKIAMATPKVVVGDCGHNALEICKCIEEAQDKGAQMIVFPELSITASTCGDLFYQRTLIEKAEEKLKAITEYSEGREIVVIVGLPLIKDGSLYNVAAVLYDGEIMGVVPKSNLVDDRYFASGLNEKDYVSICNDNSYDDEFDGDDILFGNHLVFTCPNIKNLTFTVAVGENENIDSNPATVVINMSSDYEVIGKADYRKNKISMKSFEQKCGYVYVSTGDGESSTDYVFAGHNIAAESGKIVAESERFTTGITYADIDLDVIVADRLRAKSKKPNIVEYEEVEIDIEPKKFKLDRTIRQSPFIPNEEEKRANRMEEILTMQAMALKKRLEHTNSKCAVVGISGGLDSTLALIVTAKAFDMLGLDRKGIMAVTMPGFGTTDRTYNNAVTMIKALGCTFKEISIAKGVSGHFEEIGHDIKDCDVTYENAQARYRTLILMDLANEYNGLVVGTGDMSELALGWATYNGDHMSMYGVNGGIPKTLVRYIVKHYAENCSNEQLKKAFMDVVDTPVSPELLPAKDGEIAQKTEDLVGPYELHDFFMYYILRYGFTKEKVLFLAKKAFENEYDKETISKWLDTFYRRFLTQQFKRSCLPDGVKIGTVGLSPRGDLRMPSDASFREWI